MFPTGHVSIAYLTKQRTVSIMAADIYFIELVLKLCLLSVDLFEYFLHKSMLKFFSASFVYIEGKHNLLVRCC